MSYLTEEILSAIKNEFFDIKLEYREINFGGIIPAFFISITDEITLKDQWRAITELIAIHFQSALRNEFSIWNVYLFFILEQEVKEDLKYIIENDTFSSRKIIIFSNQDIESIVQEHIKNEMRHTQSKIDFEIAPFHPNSDLWEILNRISYKKKITEDIKEGLNQIIDKIKAQEP